ncbi:MAG TPA: cytochrome B [Chromatiales bacterium]|nr:cytochrome B [Chromatiales bacterium]
MQANGSFEHGTLANPSDEGRVRVWDPLVRVLHWSLAAGFFGAYFTEDWETVHVWLGYAVLGIVALRVIWGFVGTRHARFTDFVRRPAVVAAYLRDLAHLRHRRYLGHNPAGGYMILALLLMVSLTGLSGIALYAAEEHAGPMAGWVSGAWEDPLEALHEFLANFSLFLVVVHVLGVIVESLLHGENLVRAMWTGFKRGGAT